ncbi:hypothetical protein [Candidatus Magnetobacterium casense]|uniref:Uncharacterized protein n=1 Tax=Candidatus Magnetobacterium casense TaxID=1455061 RepID=A0ABS6RUZ3_9BACT|nr:hypothetical protein [Candidatus Magnetobacterium casensis]MBV6340452.1 hypothetical protein [Candidatus Magnetobacterium casensis]
MAVVIELTNGNDDGTRMGQSTTDKIAFFGATPVVQQTGVAVATDLTTAIASTTALRLALVNLGLITTV